MIACVDMSNRKEYNHFYWNYLHAPNFMRNCSLYYQDNYLMNIFWGKFKLKHIGIIMAASLLFTTMAVGCGKIAITTTTALPASTVSATTSITTPTSVAPSITITTSLPTINTIKDSLAQVWIGDDSGGTKTFEALGVAVGDGTTVLTVIDYEDFTPGEADVRTQDNKTFSATFQSIDARTGATLLKLDSGSLPPVVTRDPATLTTNEQLTLWAQNNSAQTPTSTVIEGSPPSDYDPLTFAVHLPDGVYGGGVTQGGTVTDQNGNVLGLEGVYNYRLMIILGPIGRIPPIISITSAAELLNPNANQQPWDNGPFLSNSNIRPREDAGNGGESYIDYYNLETNTISRILIELGGPLPISDLPPDFLSYTWSWGNISGADGCLLTAVFPKPVNLCSADGTVLAQAKWVGIQWDRSNGQLSRVVYGSAAYTVAGSFAITGDTGILDSTFQTY
jgi:hypothetical protein